MLRETPERNIISFYFHDAIIIELHLLEVNNQYSVLHLFFCYILKITSKRMLNISVIKINPVHILKTGVVKYVRLEVLNEV